MTIQPVMPADDAASEERIDSLLMYRVATSHFQDRLSNLEIARGLGISRFRVARLLEQATATGVVQVKVDLPLLTDESLSDDLAQKFGLHDSKVLVDGGDDTWRRDAVSALAINHVGTLLQPGDLLGTAWGRTMATVTRVASHLSLELPQADVVQLVGGVPSATGTLDASDLVRRFSNLTGGRSVVLNAPLVVPNALIAEGLRIERSVAETLAAGRNANVALFGIGAWQNDQSNLWNLLTDSERTEIANAGAIADICGILISEDGIPVNTGFANRTIGIRLGELKQIPRRIAVALGDHRTPAIAAALRSQAITDLIVESTVARHLLSS